MLTQEQAPSPSARSAIGQDGLCENLAKLSLLTEDILLDELKQRYEHDLIYVSLRCSEVVLGCRGLTNFSRLTLAISLLLSIRLSKPAFTRHR